MIRHTVPFAVVAICALMPGHAQSQGLARIYVYVQTETPARSWFQVWCDKAVVAKLKRGRFFEVDVAPGRHTISDEKGVPVSVDAHSDKDSFVRLEWRNGDVGGPALPVWQVVSPSAARLDMLYLT